MAAAYLPWADSRRGRAYPTESDSPVFYTKRRRICHGQIAVAGCANVIAQRTKNIIIE